MRFLFLNLFLIFMTLTAKLCKHYSLSFSPFFQISFHEKITDVRYETDRKFICQFMIEILAGCALTIAVAIHLLYIILKFNRCEKFSLWFVSNPKKGTTIQPSLPEILLFYLLITDFSFDIIFLLNIDDITSLSLCSLYLARNFHTNSIVYILYLNLRLQLLFSLWRMLPY